MTAKADLEKRVERLKDRIQKAGADSERSLPPDKVRIFRKRLKRTQRKLAKGIARETKAGTQTPAQAKPAEEEPAQTTSAEEKPAEGGIEEEKQES